MKGSLTATQKKDWAKTLYLQGELSQKDIAGKVKVHETTLSGWINKEKWNQLRRSLLTRRSDILNNLYIVLEKINEKLNETDGIGDTKMADMFVKYTSAIKNLEMETSLAQHMDSGTAFHKWLNAIDPPLALTFLNHWDGFIKDQLKKF
ncbi:MAG: hypothetical protein J0M30_14795 [Chitinophagales bacterium]|nr:hypothetical protein [Chitinophagales bacterium]